MNEIAAFSLIFAGICLTFLGILLLLFSSGKKVRMEGGGALFIGPFPVFIGGTSKSMVYLVLLVSIVIFLIYLTYFKIWH